MSSQSVTLFSSAPRAHSGQPLRRLAPSSLPATPYSIHVLHNDSSPQTHPEPLQLPVVLPLQLVLPFVCRSTPLALANLRIDVLRVTLAPGVLKYHCASGSYIGAYLPVYVGRHRLLRLAIIASIHDWHSWSLKDYERSRKRTDQFTPTLLTVYSSPSSNEYAEDLIYCNLPVLFTANGHLSRCSPFTQYDLSINPEYTAQPLKFQSYRRYESL